MANEITINAFLSLLNGNLQIASPALQGLKFDQSVAGYMAGTQSIPTTAGGTAISLSADVSGSLGYAMLINTNDTRTVQIGLKPAGTFYPYSDLGPGMPALLPLTPGSAPYALAVGGAVELQIIIFKA